MKSRGLTNLFTFIAIFIAFGSGYVLGQSPFAPLALYGAETTTPEEAKASFVPFWDVWNLVHTRYFEQPVDDLLLTEGAIEGMLAVLDDPHTRYLSPDEETRSRENIAGEFQGIGAEVEAVNGDIVIVSPLDGSPAEGAGLQPGDIIRQVDGTDITGMDLHEVVLLVRGPADIPVYLLIERDGEFNQVEIIRDVIKIASVRGEILEQDIAYVRLSRFGDTTVEEMEDTLTSLLAENPIGLVLDVRRNPGGGLDTVVDIADLFLEEGIVLIERFGDGRENIFQSDDKGLAQEIPMVVLIDEGSASASEVLAGALKDRGRSILIGQTTFGKGTVQTWHSLANGGGVRITVARWLTPDENWVNDTGLVPDYYVPLTETQEGAEFEDTQLQAAVNFLRGESIISTPPENDG